MRTRHIIWCCALASLLGPLEGGAPAAAQEFSEDFSSLADGPPAAPWAVAAGVWTVRQGVLVGESAAAAARIVLAARSQPGAVSFAVDVGFESAADPASWVALTVAGAADGKPPYQNLIVRRKTSAANGVEHAVRPPAGDWSVRLARPHARDLEAGESARLEVRVGGGRLRGFIDGQLALDSPFAADAVGGAVGLEVSGARAVFDNLHLRPLSEIEIEAMRVGAAPRRDFVIIAHRGASRAAPENTLSALRLALESGAEGCEFDVWRSADGELVLLHDKTVERTTDFRSVFAQETGKDPAVGSLTLAELRRLDAGAWKSPHFRAEKIPTLIEALELLRGKITPVVEIKADDIGADVAALVERADIAGEVFVQSFSARAIREFRAALPEVPTGLLIGETGATDPIERARDHAARARQAGASAVVTSFRSVAPEYLRELHRRALSVWAYTVNDPALLEMLGDMGVDGIITDVPEAAVRLRSGLSALEAADIASAREGAAAAAAGPAVEIQPGEIPVLEFARYYSDALGLPLIGEGGDQRWLTETIVVPAAVRTADAALVKALLEENGYVLTKRRLAGGGHVVLMSSVRQASLPEAPRATPIVEVGPRAAPRRRAAATGGARRAEGPETGRLEYAGLTLASVPEILVAQTVLRPGAGVLVVAVDGRRRGAAPRRLAAALMRFDIVTHVGDERVGSPAEFKEKLETRRPGAQSHLRILRKGRALIVPLGR